jgi:hypothetical protein
MHARVITLHFQPALFDEGVRICQESIMPAAQAQAGFVTIYLLTDHASHTAMFVSLWASDADLQANEMAGFYHAQMAKLADVLAAPPVRVLMAVHAQR